MGLLLAQQPLFFCTLTYLSLTHIHMRKITIHFQGDEPTKERRQRIADVLGLYTIEEGYTTVGRLLMNGAQPIDDFDDRNIAVADSCEVFIKTLKSNGSK